MKKLLIVCVAVAGFAFAGNTSTAEAGVRVNVQFGNGGYYGCRNFNRRPYYYGRRHPFWRGTSYYNFHPGGFYQYGNHFHYQPGFYNFHRIGHWDNIHRH